MFLDFGKWCQECTLTALHYWHCSLSVVCCSLQMCHTSDASWCVQCVAVSCTLEYVTRLMYRDCIVLQSVAVCCSLQMCHTPDVSWLALRCSELHSQICHTTHVPWPHYWHYSYAMFPSVSSKCRGQWQRRRRSWYKFSKVSSIVVLR